MSRVQQRATTACAAGTAGAAKAHHQAAVGLKGLLDVAGADAAGVKARHKEGAVGVCRGAASLLPLPHVGVVLGKLDAQAAAHAPPLTPAGGREAGEQRRAGAGNLRWRAVVGQGTGAVAVSSTAVAAKVQVASPGG